MNGTSAAELIRLKRDGHALAREQLRSVAHGIGSGAWSDSQVAAFAMAVAWRGMATEECRQFTLELCDTGRRLRWDDLPGPILDKHSTGGVGDCVSLLLAPLLAACGAYVPMISGRGLGHTGGTLDKLESLTGYDVQPSPARFRDTVERAGCAIVGQSDDLVPADRRLYAVRDVTGTVDVPDLIVASILSKKIAGGARWLALDVKTGSGAQLPEIAAAHALADRMLRVADGSGLTMRVAFSDMGQVLGRDAGNALEVRAALDLLCGRGGCERLLGLTLELAGELLCMSRVATNAADAIRQLRRALATGAAAECFARMVACLGGPRDLLERPAAHLPLAPVRRAVAAAQPGYVAAIDVRALGHVVVQLGGGRNAPHDAIDHAVGLSAVAGRGARIERGEPLAIVHARTQDAADAAAAAVRTAFELAAEAPAPVALVAWHGLHRRAA